MGGFLGSRTIRWIDSRGWACPGAAVQKHMPDLENNLKSKYDRRLPWGQSCRMNHRMPCMLCWRDCLCAGKRDRIGPKILEEDAYSQIWCKMEDHYLCSPSCGKCIIAASSVHTIHQTVLSFVFSRPAVCLSIFIQAHRMQKLIDHCRIFWHFVIDKRLLLNLTCTCNLSIRKVISKC